jgi:hypothetical protein
MPVLVDGQTSLNTLKMLYYQVVRSMYGCLLKKRLVILCTSPAIGSLIFMTNYSK